MAARTELQGIEWSIEHQTESNIIQNGWQIKTIRQFCHFQQAAKIRTKRQLQLFGQQHTSTATFLVFALQMGQSEPGAEQY